jgi:glycosyltransferase involved in cell wall biosynthesis
MRVLYLTDSLSDLDGVGRYALSLIAALERLEPALSVEVLLARKHRPTSVEVPAHWKVDVGLPPDYFFYMKASRFWPSLAAASLRVAARARKADLVHAIKDYPHSLAGAVGARLAGRPCVATAHGTYTIQPLVDARHSSKARWTMRQLAGLVCVSRYTERRLFEELGEGVVDRARVRVVPNAVDAERYEAAPVLPMSTGMSTGPRPWHDVPFTLSIGELKERKGLHLALEAWVRVARDHAELHHFVVGKRSGDAYEDRLHAIARDAGLAQRVHFLGNVDEAEKRDLLQRALAFVHTPVTAADGGFEGFGIVDLEAAASGTPSVGTLGSGAEDALVDGRTGFLVPQRVEDVASALARLVGDDALRARMGDEARAHARASSWDDNARRVLELYRTVLAEGRAR